MDLVRPDDDVATSSALQDLIRSSQEDSRDLDDEFRSKEKIYQTDPAFFHQDEMTQVTDADISALSKHVKKGRELLKHEVMVNSSLRDKQDSVMELNATLHEKVMEMKKNLMFLRELREMDTMVETYSTDLSGIESAVDALAQHTTPHLEKEVKTAQYAYNESVSRLFKLKEIYGVLRETDSVLTCVVCMTSRVERFFSPCGHTACAECARRNTGRCHMCRIKYAKVCDLYFN
jgi:predicted RNase H-like nuclease (RuvC/YqgF family)